MAIRTAPAAATVKPRKGVRWTDHALGVAMLVPALTYIALLVALPFLLAVFFSLTNASAGSLEFSFVGLQNFRNVMASPVFQRALRNTFVFTCVSQLSVLVLGNILARALMKPFFGKSIVRLLILMPWAAPISLATLGWLWIFDSTFSVINWVLKVVGWLGPGQWYYWGSLMAACLITSVPIAILYNFFLDRFIAGFTVGAIK